MNKLMREVLYGMAFLQDNQMVHADIRPSLISVPLAPTQNFRLLDRLGNPSPPDEVQRMNIQKEENIYTSPAIFKAILKNKKQVRHNPFKSDMFSLGMIVLEAGILDSVQAVYDYEGGSIDETKLVELVERFIDRYPKDFVLQEALMIMLEFSEKLRQTPVKMLNTLRELKEVEIEEGRVELSYINYANDPMMNKLHITDSGYVFKEADHMLISNFSKIHQNKSKLSLMKSQDIAQEDIQRSLVNLIKEKKSQPGTARQSTHANATQWPGADSQAVRQECEMLDSFMKNEEKAREEHNVATNEGGQNTQEDNSSVEEIRTRIPVRMESVEELGRVESREQPAQEKAEDSTLGLYDKLVTKDEMFQSFKKISCEKPKKESPKNSKMKSRFLGTDKVTVSTAGDPNVFNINDYLDYYGIKTNEASEQKPEEREEPVDSVSRNKDEDQIQIRMDKDQVQMKRVSAKSEKKSPKNSAVKDEKKESVYDYFSAEKFEGLASSGDFDSEAEPLEIIPEDPKKWAELKNSFVDEVNFENAPSVTLYKGPVDHLYDPFGSRLKVKFDARKEMRKKRRQQTQIDKQNQKELMKDIRETNVIKRTIVNQEQPNRVNSGSQDKGNIFLQIASKNEDFGKSQERINKELLSQAPVDALRLKSGSRLESPSMSKLNSNFTYGEESRKTSKVEKPKPTQFKSEVVLDPKTNEVRLKSQSKKEPLKKPEKVEMDKPGKVHLKKQDVQIPVQVKTEHQAVTALTKPQPAKPSRHATKYLKLVVDEHGRKRYQMVSVENSPVGSTTKIQTQAHPRIASRSPKPVVKNFSYEPANVTHSPQVTTVTTQPVPSQTQRIELQQASPMTQPKVQYKEVPQQQTNYTLYRGTHATENQYYAQYNSKNQTEVKRSEPKYTTYTYSGNSRRFENHTWNPAEGRTGDGRMASPMGLYKPPRKSSKKVIIYRNGVKVSEKVYTEE